MKLLYITNGVNGSGGLERVLSVKASILAEQYDYEVYILGLNNANDHLFYSFSPKIKWLTISVAGSAIQYFRQYKEGIKNAVHQIQPDIISVCDDGLKGFFVPRMIQSKAKIIYERHAALALNTNAGIKGKLMRRLMRMQLKHFDKFVVLTQGNVQEWNKPNVVVIPNPLSFDNQVENKLDNKTVIAVGSHSWNKGYDRLLNIWQKIEAEYEDWQLNIYGKIDKEQTFVNQAKELALKNVRFYEPIKDIASAYLASSVMVLSSRSEGFGMVLIEAMNCGLPPISFDCPQGPADIISDGSDGFLIEDGNLEAFVERLTQLIEDKGLRVKMGAKAKQSAQKYLPEAIVAAWDKLFTSL